MKKKSLKSVVGILVMVGLFFTVFYLSGSFTIRSAIRIGYVGKEGRTEWRGSYTLFNGWMIRTLRPKTEMLHVGVKTEEGSISIEMKDADGKVIYSEENLGTTSFEVPVSGKTKIKITGSGHKGSFDISSE